MSNTERFVGIDVSKDSLDIAVLPESESWTVANDEKGISALTEELKKRCPTLIVLETTGGLEIPVTAALATANLPVAVVNPRQGIGIRNRNLLL